MNFAFSQEQEAFRETLRRFFEAKSSTAEVFRLTESVEGYEPAVWKQMAEELGLQGIHLPEEYGGHDFGFLELGIVLEEMGRVMLCSPFFSTVCLAANAIRNAGDERAMQALLPGIATGETRATLAVLDDDADSWEPADVTLRFTREGERATLDGAKRLVTDGAQADLVIVAARQDAGDDGFALVAVHTDAPGISATPVEALDPTRRLATLEFAGARGEILARGPAAAAALRKTLDQARIALSAESVGVTQRCLESSVEYAKNRVQFGQPIGAFQAIKHKCAQVLLELENAKSAAYYASWAADEDNEELPLAASLAKAFCGDALLLAAAENVQIHGGIGYTWEADPQLLYKRARFNQSLLGDAAFHRARIADLKGF